MKSNRYNAFTLIEVIICLVVMSIFLIIANVSKTAYFRYIEKKEVQSIVDTLTYTARVSVTTSTRTRIILLRNNKTMVIKYNRNESKKVIELSEGLEFYKCTKHEDSYYIYKTMAPHLGGMIHIIGKYNNYDIVFPVAIARFRLVVKDKDKEICN